VNTNSFITNVNILVDNLEAISSFNYLSNNSQVLKDFVDSGVSQYLPLVQDLAKGTHQGNRQIKLNIYRNLPIAVQNKLEVFFNQYSTSRTSTKLDYSYYVPELITYKAIKFILKDGVEIDYTFDSINTNTSSIAVIFNQLNLALSLHSDVITNINANLAQFFTLDDSVILYDSIDKSSNIEQVLLITTEGTIQTFDWYSSTSAVEFVSGNINEIRDITYTVIDVKNEVQTIADNANVTLNTTNATLDTTNSLLNESKSTLNTTNSLVNSLNNIISTLVKINWTNSKLVCTYQDTYIGDIATTAFVTSADNNLQSQINTKAPSASPTFTGKVVVPQGTASSPGLAFTGDISNDTGLYLVSDGYLGVTCNGSQVATFSPGSVNLQGAATGVSFNSITALATATPLAAGTATAGTSTAVARQDHVHPLQTTLSASASITTVAPTKVSAITGTTSGAINVPEVTFASGELFATALHQATTVSSGWRQHISIGAYRDGTASYNGGLFVGLGGNDNNPTEYYKLGFGGNITHSSGSTFWHNLNDGSGSGLDADLLDGHDSTYFAPIASPALTGTPTAPTPTAGTSTTQLATTAFVTAADNLKANNSDLLMAIGNINAPLLDLPLKNSLAMKTGVGNVTFTRASTATYIDRYGVLQVAGVDTPRFEKQGYLNEGSSTNLLTYSEQFNNSAWVQAAATISANTTATLDPYGTNLASKLVEDTTNSMHYVYSAAITVQSATLTFSCFVKAAESTKVRLNSWDSTNKVSPIIADFDLVAVTATSAATSTTSATIIPLANGWFRVSATTTSAATGVPINFLLQTTRLGNSYTGDGTSGVYIFGAQAETLSFATSYIPTTSSSVTRGADVLKVTGIGNIGLGYNAKSIVVDSQALGVVTDSRIFDIDNFNYNMMRYEATNRIQAFYDGGGISSTTNINLKHRFAYVIGSDNIVSNSITLYVDGVAAASKSNAVFSANTGTPTSIRIGIATYGGESCFAYISNFRVYDRALTAYEVSLA
jgi:hypothetical protein